MNDNISKPTAAFMSISFVGILLFVMLYDGVQGTYSRMIQHSAPTVPDLLNGSFARRADGFLKEHSPFMRETRPHWNETLLGLFNETPPGISVGSDGELFQTVYMKPGMEALFPDDKSLESIHILAQLMRESGGLFRVLVIPSKWRFKEDALRGFRPEPECRDRYKNVLSDLRRRQIDAPDVLATIRESLMKHPERELHCPSDTHLNQEGVALVSAHCVADLAGVARDEAWKRIRALPTRPIEHHGDLLLNLNIRRESALGRRLLYKEQAFLAAPCFNQPRAELLVLGDSFNYSHDYLAPRLYELVTGWSVDARDPALVDLDFQKLLNDYQGQVPRAVIIALHESRFPLH